jgi:hypothetical protein
MLYRLSQLEGTPRDAYEDARSTIALQGLSDARNPYAELRDAGDPFAIFDISKAIERGDKRMKRILRQGARLVDSPRKLRQATIDALRATRPA